MKRVALALALAASIIGLAACGDDHPGEHCVRSHDESYYMPPTYMHSGSLIIPIGGGPRVRTVCDKWVKNTPAPSAGSYA